MTVVLVKFLLAAFSYLFMCLPSFGLKEQSVCVCVCVCLFFSFFFVSFMFGHVFYEELAPEKSDENPGIHVSLCAPSQARNDKRFRS